MCQLHKAHSCQNCRPCLSKLSIQTRVVSMPGLRMCSRNCLAIATGYCCHRGCHADSWCMPQKWVLTLYHVPTWCKPAQVGGITCNSSNMMKLSGFSLGGKVAAMGKDLKKYVPEDPWTKHKRRKHELANLPNGSSREPGASYLTQLSILFIRLARKHTQSY